jgi:hypothetical protein
MSTTVKPPPIKLNEYRGNANTIVGTVTSGVTAASNAASKYLAALGTTTTPVPGATTTIPTGSVMTGLGRVASYVIGILIIVIILSLLVHYFITPVYSLHPGTPGIISIPGFDDGVIFWNGTGSYPITKTILNHDLPIVNNYNNYSMIVDVFIQNPMQFSKHPRIILSRGATMNGTPTGDNILGLASRYNLVVALAPDTTDIIVSTLNVNNQSENIIIENAPVQQAFRLGVIVMEKVMEVYINGKLAKTRKYTASLMDVKGDISPASGIESTIAKLQNLKIWPRVLHSPEIMYAKPEMASSASFGATGIPASTSCPAPAP